MSLAVVLAASSAACDGASDGDGDTGAVVVVDPEEPERVARLAVRAWDAELRLVANHVLGVSATEDDVEGQVELPWRVPLRPEDGAEGRWFRVEVDLLDDGWCPFARIAASGLYVPGEVLELEPEPETLDTAECQVAFVDVGGEGASDTEVECRRPETPCASLQHAADNYTDAGIASVIYVRGRTVFEGEIGPRGITVGGGDGGESGAPTVIRAWPGAPMPVVDGNGVVDTTFNVCCGDTAGRHLVIDGFEILGGIVRGVAFNGVGATDSVVRNCRIHDNALDKVDSNDNPPFPRSGGGVMFTNGAARIRVEHSVLENNGLGENVGAGIHVQGDTHDHELVGNRLIDNSGPGVRCNDGEMPCGEVRGTVACRNDQGIAIRRPGAVVSHCSTVGNDDDGIHVRDDATVTDNVAAYNGDEGIAIRDDTVARDNHRHNNGGDMADDGDPLLTDLDSCLLTPLPGSPLIGGAGDGSNVGAY